MQIGEPLLRVSAVDYRLGEPGLLAPPIDFDQFEEVAPARVPHDPQLAVLTLAIHDLADAVRDLTTALMRPPWYTRLWCALVHRFGGA